MREWILTVYGTGTYRCYEIKAETQDAAMDQVSAILRHAQVTPPCTLDMREWIGAEACKQVLTAGRGHGGARARNE